MPTDDARSPLIVLTGGGTGGHITPILAVAHELKSLNPNCQTVYVGERGSKHGVLTDDSKSIDTTYRVFSGKYRRFYGEPFIKRVFDIKTNLFNLRDIFYVSVGLVQAWFLLGKLNPEVVFLKGGFVGVPVGLAAAARGIPIVTHDSDALPGLANRLVSRWAKLHATAMPAETYNYPGERTKQVGVLVEHTYQPVNQTLQGQYKKQLSIPADSKVMLVTGGSSGAGVINVAVRQIAKDLLDKEPQLHIFHQAGKGKMRYFEGFNHDRLHLLEFLSPMYIYMGAADLVVCRASANTIAELGVQGKPSIIIPSPILADGHQLRNAEYLKQQNAATVITEDTLPAGLKIAVAEIMENPEKGRVMAQKLQQLFPMGAANKLAKLIIEQIK